MLCKCHWIVLYTVHFTAFCLGGGGVFIRTRCIRVFLRRFAKVLLLTVDILSAAYTVIAVLRRRKHTDWIAAGV